MDIYVSISPKFFVRKPEVVLNEFKTKDKNYVIKGFEIYFDFEKEDQLEFVNKFVYLCSEQGYAVQFHNDCINDTERQFRYLELISSYSKYFENRRMPIVYHSVQGEDLFDNVKYTNIYISKLLNYAYIKGLNVMLSMENLDDKSYAIRLDKNEMKSIIYNNEDLFFTYDIGNEIIEYGSITDVDYILEKRMINVHLHTFNAYENHLPIYPDDPNKLRWLKALTYLKLINYRGPVCLEYDYSCINGVTFEEKVLDIVKSANYVALHIDQE